MSKFQIVKGITDNLTETPYVEGKVYFVYDDINSTDLSIYADIDGARRKNAIPKVYSSTNTNGYLTMATLPIYDGTVV